MKLREHPKELFFLSMAGACQRFAFWGIGLLLVLYTVNNYGFSEKDANHLFGIYAAIGCFLPLFGGVIADRWNHVTPAIIGLIAVAIGCFTIVFQVQILLYFSLLCIGIGNGLFIPCIYTLLGNAYHKKAKLRTIGFTIYFASFNFGVFTAMMILGLMKEHIGWNSVFITSGCFSLLAIVPFLKANQVDVKPKKRKEKAPIHRYEIERLVVVVALCLATIIFYMSYEQIGASMPLLLENNTVRRVGAFEVPSSWYIGLTSFYLICLVGPLTSFYIYLERVRSAPNPIVKTILSLFIMSMAYLFLERMTQSLPIASSTIVSAFFLFAVSELLISPVGLSLVTHLSPRKYTAAMVGFWYLCSGTGVYLSGIVGGFVSEMGYPTLYKFIAIMCLGGATILAIFLRKLTKMRHIAKP